MKNEKHPVADPDPVVVESVEEIGRAASEVTNKLPHEKALDVLDLASEKMRQLAEEKAKGAAVLDQ